MLRVLAITRLIAVFALAALPSRSLLAQSELLTRVRVQHRAAVQSIQSVHCHVLTEQDPINPQLTARGQYWRQGSNVRFQQTSTGNGLDIWLREGVITQVSSGRNGSNGARVRGEQPSGGCNVWWYVMPFPSHRRWAEIALDAFLDLPHRKQAASWKTEDGRKMLYLDVVHYHEDIAAEVRKEFWFDPEVNFLFRKAIFTYEYQDRKHRIVREVSEFSEPAPGLFFPIGGTTRNYSDGQCWGAAVMTISNVRVNQPLTADIFSIKVPYGMELRDDIQGKLFRVDESGTPIEVIIDCQVVRVLLGATGWPPRLRTAGHFAKPGRPTRATRLGQSYADAQ
jgi:hypothetical protein